MTKVIKIKLCKNCGENDINNFKIDHCKYNSKCDKCIIINYRNLKSREKNYFKLYYEKTPLKYEHNVTKFLRDSNN